MADSLQRGKKWQDHSFTQQRLKEVVSYHAESGIFTWAIARPNRKVQLLAGLVIVAI